MQRTKHTELEHEKNMRLNLENSNDNMVVANRPHNVIQMQSHVVLLPKGDMSIPARNRPGYFCIWHKRARLSQFPEAVYFYEKVATSTERSDLKLLHKTERMFGGGRA